MWPFVKKKERYIIEKCVRLIKEVSLYQIYPTNERVYPDITADTVLEEHTLYYIKTIIKYSDNSEYSSLSLHTKEESEAQKAFDVLIKNNGSQSNEIIIKEQKISI